ncbi:Zinc finger, CCHC-type [Quillaja saponaria]|uniref:Zinc finger, CCHC-type n=1 Tax=Quillaja saponaria TaxID=32244 RepID=A0AAD7PG84_QUISA|nr:Zinc finger, CCHC-type [Quillaja saponaria]
MAQFLSGLNREIANVEDLQHYMELEDMVHMAMETDRQLKRKGQRGLTQLLRLLRDRNGTSNASQCPNERAMVISDSGEVVIESEGDSDEMPELVDANDDKEVEYDGESLVVRRAMSTQIKVDEAK